MKKKKQVFTVDEHNPKGECIKMNDKSKLIGDWVREVVIIVAVGFACFFVGSNQGLREQDAKVIKELRQNNQKLIQVVNFSIKRDTTGAVSSAARKVGLIK